MAKAFRHVGIVVSDLQKAIELYRDFLGLQLVAEYSNLSGEFQEKLVGIKNVLMDVAIMRTEDNNRIELLHYKKLSGKKREPVLSNDIGASHFAVTVKDIDDLFAKKDKFEVTFVSDPLESPDGFVKVAYAVFMNECIIELVQVLDERAKLSGGK
jgi:catechol 2,3-dioxygenase-like lactoylglutathione lyase family enzyme